MSRTAEEWGRLAVSLPGWRWMPGMLQRRRTGPCSGSRRSIDSDYFDTGHEARVMGGNTWPDVTDPATLGCLLALVRDAYGDARVHVRARANKWRCYSGVTPMGDWYDTEAAALVAALEAAP